MKKFKKGDVVVISKPADVYESPTWVPDMDKYDGVVCTVAEYFWNDYCFETYETDNYEFNEKWAELYFPLDVTDDVSFF